MKSQNTTRWSPRDAGFGETGSLFAGFGPDCAARVRQPLVCLLDSESAFIRFCRFTAPRSTCNTLLASESYRKRLLAFQRGQIVGVSRKYYQERGRAKAFFRPFQRRLPVTCPRLGGYSFSGLVVVPEQPDVVR